MQLCLTQKSQKVSIAFLFCRVSRGPCRRILNEDIPNSGNCDKDKNPLQGVSFTLWIIHGDQQFAVFASHRMHIAQIIIFIGCADVALCNLLYSCLLLQLCLVLFYTPATTSDCQSLKTMSKTFVPIRPTARKEAISKKLKPWRWIWRKSWKLSSQSLVSFPNSRTFESIRGK